MNSLHDYMNNSKNMKNYKIKSSVNPFLILAPGTFDFHNIFKDILQCTTELESLFPTILIYIPFIFSIVFFLSWNLAWILNPQTRYVNPNRRRPDRKKVDLICFRYKPESGSYKKIYVINRLDPFFVDAENIFFSEYRESFTLSGIRYTAVSFNPRSRCLRHRFNTSGITDDRFCGTYVRYKVSAHEIYDIRSNVIPIYQISDGNTTYGFICNHLPPERY